MRRDIRKVQSDHVNMDIEGAIESVRIKWVEFRENVRAFFLLGQSKLPVIIGPFIRGKIRRVLHQTHLK